MQVGISKALKLSALSVVPLHWGSLSLVVWHPCGHFGFVITLCCLTELYNFQRSHFVEVHRTRAVLWVRLFSRPSMPPVVKGRHGSGEITGEFCLYHIEDTKHVKTGECVEFSSVYLMCQQICSYDWFLHEAYFLTSH